MPSGDFSLAHIEQIGTAIAQLARQAQHQGQELALVRREVGAIKAVAERAVDLATQALTHQDYVTMEQYVRERKLERQLPTGKPQANYGTWLTEYCVQHGIQVREVRIVGAIYDKANAYPISVIEHTLPGFLKNVYGQGRWTF